MKRINRCELAKLFEIGHERKKFTRILPEGEIRFLRPIIDFGRIDLFVEANWAEKLVEYTFYIFREGDDLPDVDLHYIDSLSPGNSSTYHVYLQFNP